MKVGKYNLRKMNKLKKYRNELAKYESIKKFMQKNKIDHSNIDVKIEKVESILSLGRKLGIENKT